MATVDVVVSHILKHLPTHGEPLFVAVQGPQGSGKTYLSAQLRNYLTSQPHNLRTALLSIDDLYLPHSKLVQLAQSQPSNPLVQGRGLPGTHDVELGVKVLTALRDGAQVEIPRFDKSLHDGQGDRLPMDGSGVVINQPPPIDVIILEGWCVGFCPLTQTDLQNRWDGVWKEERQKLGLLGDSLCRRIDVEQANNVLASYGQLWSFFDIFIEIRPSSYDVDSPLLSRYQIVYEWRLEQERNMRAKNGGRGMPDDAVKGFVDRYIPGYVFFGDVSSSAKANPMKWLGKSLTVVIDNHRSLQQAVEF